MVKNMLQYARDIHKQWAIQQHAEGVAFRTIQEELHVRSRDTIILQGCNQLKKKWPTQLEMCLQARRLGKRKRASGVENQPHKYVLLCNCTNLLQHIAHHSTAQLNRAQQSTGQQHQADHTAPRHSTAQHSTAKHSTPHHSTPQYTTARHRTAQHTTALDSRTQLGHKELEN